MAKGSAIVAGGTGGLGRAVTAALLEEGWRCVVPYRDEQKARALAERHPGAPLELLAADLTAEAQAKRVVCAAGAALQAVVNLAGGFAAPGPVGATPLAAFQEQFAYNLWPAYALSKAAIPTLVKGGGGTVLFVSARAALRPFAGAAGYIAAKRALLALMETLVVEYGKEGVRINALLPSVIDTKANREAQPEADRRTWTAPEQIAALVAFLCSAQGQVANGATIPV